MTFDNVTLAHFLDKAEQLAASAEQIKALDAQVYTPLTSYGSKLPLPPTRPQTTHKAATQALAHFGV